MPQSIFLALYQRVGGGSLSSSPSESQIIRIWNHQLLDKTNFVTEEGEPIEVIYPGRINDDQGADFRDAVVATSRGLIKGDIEVHVRSSGWQEHGHHRNAVYNRVILHVAMWHNSKTATTLQNGRKIPILTLHKYIKIPVSQWFDWLCSTSILEIPCFKIKQRLTTGNIAGLLDRAGEKRFLAKAAKFRTDLTRMGASQTLYQGIMGALGYSKNKLSMLKLAPRLPLQTLESIAQCRISDEDCLTRQQALLLGTAGLLPSQRLDGHQENELEDKWIDKLEKLWAVSRNTRAMSHDDRHLFKVRPNNSPIRRLVAMSYLVLRYRKKGILEALVNLVNEVPVRQGYRRLEKGLLVITGDYWASHLDFGSSSRLGNPTLLGSGRAADITVNMLLPFTFAWSQFTSQPELERKAFDLYCHYPKLAVNSIERHMIAQLGISSSFVSSARQQQGLIHIYNTLCTQGRCEDCSLSQLKVGQHVQV
ncbi:DUF2851 family protein [Chloroflexota bacterium]